jgi:hypothetical protein
VSAEVQRLKLVKYNNTFPSTRRMKAELDRLKNARAQQELAAETLAALSAPTLMSMGPVAPQPTMIGPTILTMSPVAPPPTVIGPTILTTEDNRMGYMQETQLHPTWLSHGDSNMWQHGMMGTVTVPFTAPGGASNLWVQTGLVDRNGVEVNNNVQEHATPPPTQAPQADSDPLQNTDGLIWAQRTQSTRTGPVRAADQEHPELTSMEATEPHSTYLIPQDSDHQHGRDGWTTGMQWTNGQGTSSTTQEHMPASLDLRCHGEREGSEEGEIRM